MADFRRLQRGLAIAAGFERGLSETFALIENHLRRKAETDAEKRKYELWKKKQAQLHGYAMEQIGERERAAGRVARAKPPQRDLLREAAGKKMVTYSTWRKAPEFEKESGLFQKIGGQMVRREGMENDAEFEIQAMWAYLRQMGEHNVTIGDVTLEDWKHFSPLARRTTYVRNSIVELLADPSLVAAITARQGGKTLIAGHKEFTPGAEDMMRAGIERGTREAEFTRGLEEAEKKELGGLPTTAQVITEGAKKGVRGYGRIVKKAGLAAPFYWAGRLMRYGVQEALGSEEDPYDIAVRGIGKGKEAAREALGQAGRHVRGVLDPRGERIRNILKRHDWTDDEAGTIFGKIMPEPGVTAPGALPPPPEIDPASLTQPQRDRLAEYERKYF